jgi:hypothetical protein
MFSQQFYERQDLLIAEGELEYENDCTDVCVLVSWFKILYCTQTLYRSDQTNLSSMHIT